MKRVSRVLMVFFLFLMSACLPEKRVKLDEETNRYYSEYIQIFNDYELVNKDSTISSLKNYTTEFPNEYRGWAFLGKVFFDLEKLDSAAYYYQKALLTDSTKAECYTYLAALNDYNGQAKKALELYQKAILKGDTSIRTRSATLLIYSLHFAEDKEPIQQLINSLNTKKNDSLSDNLSLSLQYLAYRALKETKRMKQCDSLLTQRKFYSIDELRKLDNNAESRRAYLKKIEHE